MSSQAVDNLSRRVLAAVNYCRLEYPDMTYAEVVGALSVLSHELLAEMIAGAKENCDDDDCDEI